MIPSKLHMRRDHKNSLIRRTNGQSFGTLKKTVLFRISGVIRQKSSVLWLPPATRYIKVLRYYDKKQIGFP
jgi:hypothetical protein